MKKGLISGLLVAVVLGAGYEWITLNHPNAGVLGTQALLARGGEDNGGGGEDQHNSEPAKVEIHMSDTNVGSGKIETPNMHVETNKEKIEVHIEKHKVEPSETPEPTNVLEKDQEQEDVKVASDDGDFHVKGDHFGAKSHFPLSVDPVTHELTVTTPAGIKVVTVLPDKAVQNILTKGILSKIGNASSSASTGDNSGSTESGAFGLSAPVENVTGTNDQNIELTTDNGTPVYKVKGSKSKKFLGFIPVNVDKTVTVAADTGEVTSTQTSFFNNFLDFLSF